MNPRFRHKSTPTAFVVTLALGLVLVLSAFGGVGFAKNPGPAQAQYGKKVALCHKGKKTVNVSKNAVKAHVKHGDVLGSCATDAKAKRKADANAKKHETADATPKADAKAKKHETADATPKGKGHGKK